VQAAGGFVGEPSKEGAQAAGDWLAEVARDPEGLLTLGKRSRALAESRFDIDRITDEFETVLAAASGLPVVPAPLPRAFGRLDSVRASS
jgi:hypothetical protein